MVSGRKRAFATTTDVTSQKHQTDRGEKERTSVVQYTLTLLYKTRGLVPRILPSGGTLQNAGPREGQGQVELGTGEFWEEVLDAAKGDLERAFVSKEGECVRVVGMFSPLSTFYIRSECMLT